MSKKENINTFFNQVSHLIETKQNALLKSTIKNAITQHSFTKADIKIIEHLQLVPISFIKNFFKSKPTNTRSLSKSFEQYFQLNFKKDDNKQMSKESTLNTLINQKHQHEIDVSFFNDKLLCALLANNVNNASLEAIGKKLHTLFKTDLARSTETADTVYKQMWLTSKLHLSKQYNTLSLNKLSPLELLFFTILFINPKQSLYLQDFYQKFTQTYKTKTSPETIRILIKDIKMPLMPLEKNINKIICDNPICKAEIRKPKHNLTTLIQRNGTMKQIHYCSFKCFEQVDF